MSRVLHADITGSSDIYSVTIDQDYSQPTSSMIFECDSTTLSLGDSVQADVGFDDDHAVLFTGYVLEKDVQRDQNGVRYSVRCRDQLWRAMAYFIAAEDPQSPLEYSNIESATLVQNMLEMSGITSYSLDVPGFTFAPEEPLEVQLTSAWDMIQRICQLIAWHCYDDYGTVRFLDRKPYNVAGDSPVATLITGTGEAILAVQPFSIGSDKIRNRVVVYGREGVYASAQASSPFLPAGFYKTEAISAPDLIDTTSMAQDIADYNLELLNRLEKTATVNIEGNPTVRARRVVTVTEEDTGVSGDWFVYGCRHEIRDTYTTNMTLVQRQTS